EQCVSALRLALLHFTLEHARQDAQAMLGQQRRKRVIHLVDSPEVVALLLVAAVFRDAALCQRGLNLVDCLIDLHFPIPLVVLPFATTGVRHRHPWDNSSHRTAMAACPAMHSTASAMA